MVLCIILTLLTNTAPLPSLERVSPIATSRQLRKLYCGQGQAHKRASSLTSQNDFLFLPFSILCIHIAHSWHSSVARSCPTFCTPVDCSMPGFLVHHQLQEVAQTHVCWVGDAIQPSHPHIIFKPSCLNPEGLLTVLGAEFVAWDSSAYLKDHSPFELYVCLLGISTY